MEEESHLLENHEELVSAFPLIGEYIIYFSYLQETVEHCCLDITRRYSRGYGSRFSGLTLGNIQEVEKLAKMIVLTSPWIYTKRVEKNALSELRTLVEKLKFQNETRNILVHGYWQGWSTDRPVVEKSEKVYDKRFKDYYHPSGRSFYTMEKEDIKKEITSIKILNIDVFNFFQKYQFGDNLYNENPRQSKWYKQKITLLQKRNADQQELSKLKNLGFATIVWLEVIGIYSPNDLKKIGAVKAYNKILFEGHERDVRLLKSLIGAITDIDWKKVKI